MVRKPYLTIKRKYAGIISQRYGYGKSACLFTLKHKKCSTVKQSANDSTTKKSAAMLGDHSGKARSRFNVSRENGCN
jgi:hypothetical protein